jgi:hypothetical protein
VLTSQGDGELVIVQHPGRKCQDALLVPLTSPVPDGETLGNTTVDDTVFATSAGGVLLVADKGGEAIYSITAPYFAPGAAYSAVVVTTTPMGSTASAAFVGQTDLTTGFISPIVSELQNPGGMAFVPSDHDAQLEPVGGGQEAGECP